MCEKIVPERKVPKVPKMPKMTKVKECSAHCSSELLKSYRNIWLKKHSIVPEQKPINMVF